MRAVLVLKLAVLDSLYTAGTPAPRGGSDVTLYGMPLHKRDTKIRFYRHHVARQLDQLPGLFIVGVRDTYAETMRGELHH